MQTASTSVHPPWFAARHASSKIHSQTLPLLPRPTTQETCKYSANPMTFPQKTESARALRDIFATKTNICENMFFVSIFCGTNASGVIPRLPAGILVGLPRITWWESRRITGKSSSATCKSLERLVLSCSRQSEPDLLYKSNHLFWLNLSSQFVQFWLDSTTDSTLLKAILCRAPRRLCRALILPYTTSDQWFQTKYGDKHISWLLYPSEMPSAISHGGTCRTVGTTFAHFWSVLYRALQTLFIQDLSFSLCVSTLF